MFVINTTKAIILSQDGTSYDQSLPKANIASINEHAFIGNVNFSQANPLNKTNYASIEIKMNDGSGVMIDLNNVSNQINWPPTQAGIKQALSDLNSWL